LKRLLRPRIISALLAAVLFWAAGAPLLAITCLPGQACPMAGMAHRLATPKAGGVSAPDCCGTSERRSEPGTLSRAFVQPADAAQPAVQPTEIGPLCVERRGEAARLSAPARDVPLYTLHSILLI
jgi:hypothetical protein